MPPRRARAQVRFSRTEGIGFHAERANQRLPRAAVAQGAQRQRGPSTDVVVAALELPNVGFDVGLEIAVHSAALTRPSPALNRTKAPIVIVSRADAAASRRASSTR